MRIFCSLFFFLYCNLAFSYPIVNREIDPKALSQLTSYLGIPEEADLIKETQKKWLRKPNKERWEMGELAQEQREFVLDWGKEEGIYSPWAPALQNYDKAFILGASTGIMEKRLNYLIKLWKEGIRFQEIVWLTGERPLNKSIDGLFEICAHESEAAHFIWKKTDLPEEMETLPVVFIDVPMKEGNKRPNTKDTIIGWLATNPSPCSCLFISDQPFCGYQFSIITSSLPDDFAFDVAGEGVNPEAHPLAAAITLDSIARWLYQEDQNRKE